MPSAMRSGRNIGDCSRLTLDRATPDPDPVYTRFFTPAQAVLSTDLDQIGQAYIGALAKELAQWLPRVPDQEPIGVCFSGGIDSGSVFLTAYHVML